jgi:hypothetical protein
MSVSRIRPDGYFDYDLTEGQIQTLYPSATHAIVFYTADGMLEYIVLSETVTNDILGFKSTEIKISDKEIPTTMLFDVNDEPVVSYVQSVPVTVISYSPGWDNTFVRADFMLQGIYYRVSVDAFGFDYEKVQESLTETVNWLIVNGAADLTVFADPVIPKLRNESLTLQQAQQDIHFGAYLPAHIPEGLRFESARRVLTTRDDSLFAMWHSPPPGLNSISWTVAKPVQDDFNRLVSAADRHKYDTALYSIPWFSSVPHQYNEYFQNPVFAEISLDIIQARTFRQGRSGAESWQTASFSFLVGDGIVTIFANGLTAEQIWEMLPF